MAIKSNLGSKPLSNIEPALLESLNKTSEFIKGLSLASVDDEIVLLSALLISAVSQKDLPNARYLAEVIVSIIQPPPSIVFRSNLSKSIAKEAWGLDPDLLTREH